MTNSENMLSDLRVGLSLSESPDIEALGFSDVHFKGIVIEFSRYMLACGATLAYGGDFRQGGFTEVLFDLKATYKGNASKIVSYLGWPIHAEMGELTDAEKLRFQDAAEFEKSPIPDGVDESIPRDKFLPPIKTNLDNMLIWARSMSKMRREYLAKENDAQILLGGRLTNYSSKYPGVVEEAYEIMKAGKPLFLIGAFGGATKAVIDAVSGARPESLTEAGQYELWTEFEAETHKAKAATARHDLEQAPLEIAAAEEAIKSAEAELKGAEVRQTDYRLKRTKRPQKRREWMRSSDSRRQMSMTPLPSCRTTRAWLGISISRHQRTRRESIIPRSPTSSINKGSPV